MTSNSSQSGGEGEHIEPATSTAGSAWRENEVNSFCLRRANVLDESGEFQGPLDIVVNAGQVTAVGRSLATDAAQLDATDLFILPGIFDCHDHLTMSTADTAECLTTPLTQAVLETAQNARLTLEAGVTFVRDLAGLDRGIRDAIARAYVAGPRVQTSIVMLSQTGGHADLFLAGAALELSYLFLDYPGRPPFVVDGPDAIRRAVRELIRNGADWIKLAATGGLVSDFDQPLVSDFTRDELELAIFEAHRKGKPVAAHAYGGDGLTAAVRAGVRSIEHGSFLTEEQAALMAERGCWLVPTLSAMRDCLRLAENGYFTPTQCEKILSTGLEVGACVRIAKEYNVPLASGSDYITRMQHGKNLEELALMREAGLSPAEVICPPT